MMMPKATSITDVAEAFFDACERGKGWEVCHAYCTPNATFSAQAEPLLDLRTLAQYTDWMKGILTVLSDARYEVKSFATDSCGPLESILADFLWIAEARRFGGAEPRSPAGAQRANGRSKRDL
jgi:hypothetical protein